MDSSNFQVSTRVYFDRKEMEKTGDSSSSGSGSGGQQLEKSKSTSSSPRREKRRSNSGDIKSPPRPATKNPFNAFAPSREPKVRVLQRNTASGLLEVRNRDKWLNIEQASRLANAQKQGNKSKMKEFKEKHARTSNTWNNVDKNNLQQSSAEAIKRAPVPVWHSKQSVDFVQRGMLKPGVVKSVASIAATKESSRPVHPSFSRITSTTSTARECMTRGDVEVIQIDDITSTFNTDVDESEVIVLDSDDLAGKDSIKGTYVAGRSATKDLEKYQVHGAWGWYVSVPESRFNNQFIPVLPRLKKDGE